MLVQITLPASFQCKNNKRDFLSQCLEGRHWKNNYLFHTSHTLKQKHTPTTSASVIILINRQNYNSTIKTFFNCELLTTLLLLEVSFSKASDLNMYFPPKSTNHTAEKYRGHSSDFRQTKYLRKILKCFSNYLTLEEITQDYEGSRLPRQTWHFLHCWALMLPM